MKARAYCETSVWSRLLDREDPEKRRQTRAFLELGRRRLKWFASVAVTAELRRTRDPVLRKQLFRRMKAHRPRAVTRSAETARILRALVARRIGTPARLADMLHLALAVTGRMDYFVSWDEAHLANPRIDARVREYCREKGYNQMWIGTPVQVEAWARRQH